MAMSPGPKIWSACAGPWAMLSPGQPAGMTREDAMDLLAELHATAGELARLQRGLRALLEGDDSA